MSLRGIQKNIFKNMNLKVLKTGVENIFNFNDYGCIGFDLDNTLARYKVGAMVEMEYNILAKYLVKNKGYSGKHLLKPIDEDFFLKGLILDNENGNILKISWNGEIIFATHGTKVLTNIEINQYYNNCHWKATDIFADNPLQAWYGPYSEKMRTLLDYFDIVASLIFARAVDEIDESKDQRHYNEVWPNILEVFQDMFNNEQFTLNKGSYYPEIKAHPEKYYYKCSEKLLSWLKSLKESGKILFLITGAHLEFASLTASSTIGPDWRNFFDIVVTYAKKPGFFTENREFIALNEFEEVRAVGFNELKLGKTYSHGNWNNLQKLFRKHSGNDNLKFLYVGDNLIQDIYTPSEYSHCDTVAVCEELDAEGIDGNEMLHPDKKFLVSSVWGSYFCCDKTNQNTNWTHIIEKHSKMCIPSMDYVASYPVNHEYGGEL